MKERVCIVTGASSGIGRATALGLAQIGATVVLVCRDRKRGESVVNEAKQRYKNSSVDLLLADLSSQESIRALANQYVSKYERLHVLINNAGAYFTKRHVTADGIETLFAVNYLAPFLLTNLLLDTLQKSAPSRIINVAGAHHSKGKINFDDLQGAKDFNGSRAIAQSKLAVVLYTYELARRLEGTGVTVNCSDPGMVATNLTDKDEDFPKFYKYMFKLLKPFLKSPEKGAVTSIYLASSPEVEGITGQYFIDKKIIKSSPASHDIDTAKHLWDVSVSLTDLNSR
jgi:NAD(P)-dependent dehydrogenase (short-subunit alcohol dehydrogenase family)